MVASGTTAGARGAGAPPPVVLLAGDDRDGRERALDRLRESLPDEAREVGVERFDGRDLARALDAARTVPLFGGRRLIVVRDVDWLAGRGGDELREALTQYLAAPAERATVVLVADKADRRLAVVKAIDRAGGLVACERPKERDMPRWLQERARERGIVLPPRAAAALADAVGTDTALASRELDKLALLLPDDGAAGRRRAVDEAMLEQALGPTRAVGAFALEDALLEGRRADALGALERHLAGGGPGEQLAVLARLAGIARRLAVARAVVAGGGSEDDVRQRLGCHPFVARKYTRAARGRPGNPDAALAACVRADRAIKSSADGPAVLREIILALTAQPAGTRGGSGR
ncbi:MAG: DNA polymerase III subunit delta [Acidobacteriota bacterium]